MLLPSEDNVDDKWVMWDSRAILTLEEANMED